MPTQGHSETVHGETLDLKYFDDNQCRSCTERSKKSFTDLIDGKDRKFLAPLDPFSLVSVGLYKRLSTSESAVILRLAEAQFKVTERSTSFETAASKEYFINEISINADLKAWLRQ